VRTSYAKHINPWRQAGWLALFLLASGCALHKKEQPLPTFPPVPLTALRQLPALPPRNSYDRVAILTVEADSGDQLARSINRIRETAAQKGADAIVVLRDVEFSQKSGKRIFAVRRITYLAIHRR
jgi:hypothetical protein